jgi:hypothetical protein
MGSQGKCDGCGKQSWLVPLHGDKGGPLRCYLCAGEWNAQFTRRRKWGRIIIKAMAMYTKENGFLSSKELNAFSLAASGFSVSSAYEADTIGADAPDLTTELLADLLQLVHPDRHPPNLKQLATRVTQDLLELKPFVFPAPKPGPEDLEPKPMKPQDNDHSLSALGEHRKYPCFLCADTYPLNYCSECRAEWEKRSSQEDEQRRAKQRELHARRKARKKSRPKHCLDCGRKIEIARRADSKFCSSACRQRHYRQRDVTEPSRSAGNLERAVTHKRSRKVWKFEERDGQLWHGNRQMTDGGGPGERPHGSIGWGHGNWKLDYDAIDQLWPWHSRQNYYDLVHRCSNCEGWILAHPNTLYCNECKRTHDALRP